MADAPKLYLARAGRNGEDEDLAIENNLAIIDFRDVPSLEGANDYDAVAGLVNEALPDYKPRARGNFAGQLWAFSVSMENGDLVVLPRKLTSQVAIGRVTGPYEYREVNAERRHTRPVQWLKTDIPRAIFERDLLYSFGAFMTVCQISRNDAARRVASVLGGKPDPGPSAPTGPQTKTTPATQEQAEVVPDLVQMARDQIVARIQSRFLGHDLTRLVDAVLRVEGWVTKVSPPGPDGGVDILAGRGTLGLDGPRLCVQVKSQQSPADVTVYRTLQGTMQTFSAEQGLLVCWGGFTRAVEQEARQSHFTVRLWDSSDLVTAILRNYDRLPAEIQAELPLMQIWVMVVEDQEE